LTPDALCANVMWNPVINAATVAATVQETVATTVVATINVADANNYTFSR